MTIERIDADRWKIALEAAELRALQIGEGWRPEGEPARQAIARLLARIQRATGLAPLRPEALSVELRRQGEGAELYLTGLASGAPPQLWEFASLSHLAQGCAALLRQAGPGRFERALFAHEGRYRLRLAPCRGQSPRPLSLLGEFGRLLPPGGVADAATREHWRPLAGQQAVEPLARLA